MSDGMQLNIKFGNAAFDDGNRASEVERILKEVAAHVAAGRDQGVIHDINGNRVGEWYYDPEEEPE